MAMHQSTYPPGGPLSCRLNICLMAISCLNMSWAKPLCERPGEQMVPCWEHCYAPTPKHFLWMRRLFSFPFAHPVCSSPFHGHEGVKDLPHHGQREMACFTWPKTICKPASLFHPSPSLRAIPVRGSSPDPILSSSSKPIPQCLGSVNA